MKRDPRLRDLSSDHHQALVLARRARRAAEAAADPAPVWAEVARRFAAELEPHFQLEERYLLPALDRAGATRLAARTREDHAALRACLKGAPAELRDRLMRFGELLAAHARFEERELFEEAQRLLPDAELDALAAATAAHGAGGAP